MSKILHIQASPRGAQSFSARAAEALLAELRRARHDDTVETLDLFTAPLPEFAAPATAAKYAVMAGQEPVDDAQRAWKEVTGVIDSFMSARAYVISSPLWNFGIPYRLKHYLDLVVQPGLTFGYSPQTGYEGLVTGRPMAMVLARGGAYLSGSGMEAYDFQLPYLRTVLGFLGFSDIHEVIVEPTMLRGPDTADQALQRAIERARAVGREIAGRM